MNEHFINDALRRLAIFFATSDPGQPAPRPEDLGDPAGYGEFALIVCALQHGASPEEVLAFLPVHLKAALWAQDPSRPPRPPIEVITARDLLAKTFPPPVWAVPGLIPSGLTILAGRPKLGKSWLSLQIAQAIATGGRVFGEKVERGAVLYLGLEDSQRRLQERMALQGWPKGDAAGDADFITLAEFVKDVGHLDAAGCEKLAAQWEARRYRLVVVDTLSRAIRGDQNDVAVMTTVLSPLQNLAISLNAGLLICDHHKKAVGDATDPVLDLMGSVGKGAVADGLLGLYREQGKAGAILHLLGRDMPERKLRLVFDALSRCWQCEGDAEALRLTDARQEVLEALEEIGPATYTEVALRVGKDASNTRKKLQELVNAGLVVLTKGKYVLA